MALAVPIAERLMFSDLPISLQEDGNEVHGELSLCACIHLDTDERFAKGLPFAVPQNATHDAGQVGGCRVLA